VLFRCLLVLLAQLLFVGRVEAAETVINSGIGGQQAGLQTRAGHEAAKPADSNDPLARYPQTPFTLALLGEADVPEGGNIPDPQSASDVAYCAFLMRRAGLSARTGSEFSNQNLARARTFETHLQTFVGSRIDRERLLERAEATFYAAIQYARSSNNAQAAMNFNFGGHQSACLGLSETL